MRWGLCGQKLGGGPLGDRRLGSGFLEDTSLRAGPLGYRSLEAWGQGPWGGQSLGAGPLGGGQSLGAGPLGGRAWGRGSGRRRFLERRGARRAGAVGVGTGGGQVGKGSGYSVHGGLQEAGAPEGEGWGGRSSVGAGLWVEGVQRALRRGW